MNQSEIKALILQELEPFKTEIKALRNELEALKNPYRSAEIPMPEVAQEITPESAPPLEVAVGAPQERQDFMRFLQRGLEQEQREFSEEPIDTKPEPKKGWNPFKR